MGLGRIHFWCGTNETGVPEGASPRFIFDSLLVNRHPAHPYLHLAFAFQAPVIEPKEKFRAQFNRGKVNHGRLLQGLAAKDRRDGVRAHGRGK